MQEEIASTAGIIWHALCRALAKVALARKLAVRLYWMLCLNADYTQLIQCSDAG